MAATLAAPLAAQASPRWSATPALGMSRPLGTMGDYLGTGAGIALGVRRGDGPVAFRADVSWTHFAARAVSRPINGTGPAIGITSSANTMLVLGGPEFSVAPGRFRLTLGVAGGAAHVLATGSTVLPGDPAQVNRSNTYATLTWAGKVRAAVAMRAFARAQIVIEGAFVQAGKTEFLREYNLPIGVISGIYLNPTPYSPSFAVVTAGMTVPL